MGSCLNIYAGACRGAHLLCWQHLALLVWGGADQAQPAVHLDARRAKRETVQRLCWEPVAASARVALGWAGSMLRKWGLGASMVLTGPHCNGHSVSQSAECHAVQCCRMTGSSWGAQGRPLFVSVNVLHLMVACSVCGVGSSTQAGLLLVCAGCRCTFLQLHCRQALLPRCLARPGGECRSSGQMHTQIHDRR